MRSTTLLRIAMSIARHKLARRATFLFALMALGCRSGIGIDASSSAQALPQLGAPNDGGAATRYEIEGPGSTEYSLKTFSFPREAELLREHNLVDGEEYQKSVSELTNWVERRLSSAEREKIIKRCASLYGNADSTIVPAAHNLACLAWQVEKNAASRNLKRSRQNKAPSYLVTVKSEAQWKELAGRAFYDSFLRVDPLKVEELEKLAVFARSTVGNCSYGAATAALIARAETFLPSETSSKTIEEFYPMVTRCLKPEDEGFERTHLRVGLLRILKNENEKAKESLLRAQSAKEPAEDFRSLFWLGALAASNEGDSPKQNEYWNLLLKRYPLSYHSVLASHSMGIDPMEKIASGDDVKLARRAGKQWSDFDSMAFVFELLVARNEAAALSSWSNFVARYFDGSMNPLNTLYLAHCHSMAENYRASFSLLTSYLRQSRRETVSLELLNLIFPRPYATEILTHSASVDPLLIFALIRQESAFDPFARSGANARGLMQVLPSTARKIKATPTNHLYEPSTNIEIGTTYFRELLKKHNGTVEHALASYNAGGRNLEKWKMRYSDSNILLFADLIPFKETRTYVSIILRNTYWYGRLMVHKNDSLAQTVIRHSTKAAFKSHTVTNLLNVAWSKNSSLSLAGITNIYMPQKSISGSDTSLSAKPLPDEKRINEIHRIEEDSSDPEAP